jgi:hypothetical protein
MKAKAAFLLLVCALIFGCENKSTSPIVETWQLVNGKGVLSDSSGRKSFDYPGNINGNQWKIITKAHFAKYAYTY